MAGVLRRVDEESTILVIILKGKYHIGYYSQEISQLDRKHWRSEGNEKKNSAKHKREEKI